jgi:hypothetical protein
LGIEGMGVAANILPVFEPIIRGRMYYAFPLCIVDASDRHVQSWIMSRFIQLQAHTLETIERTGIAELRFFRADHPECFTDAYDIEHVPIGDSSEGGITNCIREAIAQQKYVYLYVDKFYVPDNPFSLKKHVVQESLIYGDEDGQYHILGFNRNRQFAKSKVSHADMARGYQHSSTPRLFYLKAKDFGRFSFDQGEIREKLYQYVHSTGSGREETHGELSFGLQVYPGVRQSIRNIADRAEFVIPNIAYLHILAEHKKLMHQRLQVFRDSGAALGTEAMLQYRAFEKQMMKLRNDLIKYEANRKDAILHLIDDALGEIALSEKQCLTSFLDGIPC